MARDTWLIVGLLMVSAFAPLRAQMRLEGLERLYFDHAAGPGETLPAPQNVSLLLPVALPKPQYAATASQPLESDGDLFIRDFELRLDVAEHPLWIREVTIEVHPRISESWWALYDAGRRSDVWYFTATPDRTDGKMLSNYRLDSLLTPRKGRAVFRVRGEMFRPMGAWWVVGKEFLFHTSATVITFVHVRNVFGFFQSYDTDSIDGALSVSTEREVKGRFETREISPVSESSAAVCGFRNPVLAAEWEFSWTQLEKAARCIVSQRGALVSDRDLHAPSFAERTGSPPKRDPR